MAVEQDLQKIHFKKVSRSNDQEKSNKEFTLLQT